MTVRQLVVIAAVAGIIVSTASAHPLTVVLAGNDAGWFTVDNVREYQTQVPEDADGKPVFTGHPSYVAGSDATLLFDMPRIHYYASTFADSPFGDRLFRKLAHALRTGQAEIAIAGPMTQAILEFNESVETAFVNNYCRAPPDKQGIYQKTGATLYYYQPDCPDHRTPDVEAMDGAT